MKLKNQVREGETGLVRNLKQTRQGGITELKIQSNPHCPPHSEAQPRSEQNLNQTEKGEMLLLGTKHTTMEQKTGSVSAKPQTGSVSAKPWNDIMGQTCYDGT